MTNQTQAQQDYTDRWHLASGLHTLTCTGAWFVQPCSTFQQGFYLSDMGTWYAVPVPGHWQQHPALTEHTGKAVYRHHFAHPTHALTGGNGAQPERLWLRCNGIFYWHEVYLNGTTPGSGQHEGYFIPAEYEITSHLHEQNTLLIEVDCPDEHNKYHKRLITGVFSHWDCLDPHLNAGGVWLPVEITTSGPIHIQQVRCATDTFNTEVANLRYTVDLDSTIEAPAVLRWTIAPRNFSGETHVIEQRRTIPAGQHSLGGLFKIQQPHLWWTHDLGPPDLYTISLDILLDGTPSDHARFAFGVRSFELRDWIPYLNGVRFLAKGNNYAPGDMWVATMNYERCLRDLHLARDCHMNMLRIHAHVDHPALYHAANEVGILLWQDMPLQWLYQQNVLPEARRQVRAMVRLLTNHPSIAVWCMHNEPVFVGDTADERIPTRMRTYGSSFGFSWNRDVLDTRLKQIAQTEDPHRPVVRSSGEFQIPFFKGGTDAHAYFGWYSSYGTLANAEQMMRRMPKNLRFMTEFGAQSFPNLESCRKFMPAEPHDIDFDYLALRHSFQPDVMARWLPWREAPTLQALIDMTQDYQIFINRYYIDRLRYHKYRPTGGILPFMLLDPYPAILWSIIDYWRVPKRSYYALQMAFCPHYAFSLIAPRPYRLAEPIALPIYAVNDTRYPVDVQVDVHLYNPEQREIATIQHTLTLDADCLTQEIDRLRLTPSVRGTYTVRVQLHSPDYATDQTYEVEIL